MSSVLLSTFTAMMFAAQAVPAPAPSSTPPAKTTTPVTLSGCVSRDNVAVPEAYTFAEAGTDRKYRLSGVGVKEFADHRVEIIGAPVERRLSVHFGLLPSPNLAAQAGALDPADVAIASLPGGANTTTGTAPVELPEFRVTAVRPLGSCR
jgi:hypothetical protein